MCSRRVGRVSDAATRAERKPRHAVWATRQGSGLEHVVLSEASGGLRLESSAVEVIEGEPYRVRYRIDCDAAWRVRHVVIRLAGRGGAQRLALDADGAGHWHTAAGEALAGLDGCIDIDLSSTPATNTLPIRRLGLAPGEDASFDVVYVALPALEPVARSQRYERVPGRGAEARYRYTSGSFSVVFAVDADGLVGDYPGYWRRIALASRG